MLPFIFGCVFIVFFCQVEGQAPEEISVTAIMETPFIILKDKGSVDDRFEGFIIDILKEFEKNLNVKFKISLVKDGQYGSVNKNGVWNGMIGELLRKEANMTAAPLTITSMRERVVDFSKPFLSSGITMLGKKPLSDSSTTQFGFLLLPFPLEIWLAIIAAYITMSAILFILARFTEWNDSNENSQENKFTFLDSFWYTFGFPGKPGISPTAVSTRIVSAVWWIFTFFILAAYVASLFWLISVGSKIMPATIMSASDLPKQSAIRFGTVSGGSTLQFFRTSRVKIYEQIWVRMDKSEPSAFVQSTSEGVERVKAGRYIFFGESASIDYTVNRNCDLMKIGGLLNRIGFGFAFPIGSTLKDRISLAILRMQEDGLLHMLYQKWWKPTIMCDEEEEDKDKEIKFNQLSSDKFGAAFIVLILGVAISIFVALIECFYQARKSSLISKKSSCEEFANNFRRNIGDCCSSSRNTPGVEGHSDVSKTDT